jgi:hypothetical protein
MIKYNIRKKCIQCAKKGNSCCYNCKECGKNGCKTKSLICKLWLCKDIMLSKDYKRLSKDKKWIEINKIAIEHIKWIAECRITIKDLYTVKGNSRKNLSKCSWYSYRLQQRLKGNLTEF